MLLWQSNFLLVVNLGLTLLNLILLILVLNHLDEKGRKGGDGKEEEKRNWSWYDKH